MAEFTQRVLTGVHNLVYTLLAFPRAWRFMWRHKLWRGLRQYGWVAKFLVTIGVVVGIYMIGEAIDFFNDHRNDAVQALFMTTDSLFVRLASDAYESLSDGALKWIILVLLEVVIYHFMRRSLALILDKQAEDQHTFKPFFTAQKRMIIVSFLAFCLESCLLGLTEGLFPVSVYVVTSTLISSAFLGFVIADNYNEQFGLNIKQSFNNLYRHYIGICIGLGLPLYFILKLPLVGAVIGPLVTSVTAAIVLRELSDLHLIGYQMSEKEQRKAEKKEAKRARRMARKAKRAERV